MESLLFLAHRLPYPPNKGDKVRSYHFLGHLARRYRVLLGTFVDDPADAQHVPAVRELCAEVQVEAIAPWPQRARSLGALLSGEALSLPYFRSARLAAWAAEAVRRHGVRKAFVYSSPMAQYALDLPGLETFVDFVDMDSAKWRDYATRRRWPASLVYGREARCLLDYERRVAARSRASLFVTEEEAQRFRSAAPECAARVRVIRNGVDAAHFSPAHRFASPFHPGERAIVFTGAMDYWPNVDAVVWFAREVLPLIRRSQPSARFYIVGMNPDSSVRALAGGSAVTVTGRVPDVRPYLQHAAAVVAPLRVARGIQNKVLEAMAMAKPVVASAACAAALSARPGIDLAVASDAAGFAAATLWAMQSEQAQPMAEQARLRVMRDYAWSSSLRQLDELFGGADRPVPQTAMGA
jgi:sugar transferase (PEP-CTERM/EpsH1 system associated)